MASLQRLCAALPASILFCLSFLILQWETISSPISMPIPLPAPCSSHRFLLCFTPTNMTSTNLCHILWPQTSFFCPLAASQPGQHRQLTVGLNGQVRSRVVVVWIRDLKQE